MIVTQRLGDGGLYRRLRGLENLMLVGCCIRRRSCINRSQFPGSQLLHGQPLVLLPATHSIQAQIIFSTAQHTKEGLPTLQTKVRESNERVYYMNIEYR